MAKVKRVVGKDTKIGYSEVLPRTVGWSRQEREGVRIEMRGLKIDKNK